MTEFQKELLNILNEINRNLDDQRVIIDNSKNNKNVLEWIGEYLFDISEKMPSSVGNELERLNEGVKDRPDVQCLNHHIKSIADSLSVLAEGCSDLYDYIEPYEGLIKDVILRNLGELLTIKVNEIRQEKGITDDFEW